MVSGPWGVRAGDSWAWQAAIPLHSMFVDLQNRGRLWLFLKVTSGLTTYVPVNTLILQVKIYKERLKGVAQSPFLIFQTLHERISTD